MTQVQERADFVVGEAATITKTITLEDVEAFAALTGDYNPVHVDDAYAAGTLFGGRIVHGMFLAGLISAVIGTTMPGPGAIYMTQELRFTAPAYPGDTLTARVEVTAWDGQKGRITLATEVRNQDGKQLVMGDARLVMSAFLKPRA